MVLFKVTDGVETRRIRVASGEITFQQLQERIATLFPNATKELSNLTLRYRDSDGDVITLSSDEEFQEVLSDLPNDHIWKLHIHTPPKAREGEARPRQGTSLLDQLLQSPFAVRGNPWAVFDKELRETQELVELLFGLHGTKPSESEEKSTSEETTQPATSGESSESSTSEGAAEPVTTENEDRETTGGQEDAQPSQDTPKEGDDEEVKSKHPPKKASGSSDCPASHHCHVKRIHLLEPTIFGGLFGPRLLSPSVGYHITLTPRANSTAASSA